MWGAGRRSQPSPTCRTGCPPSPAPPTGGPWPPSDTEPGPPVISAPCLPILSAWNTGISEGGSHRARVDRWRAHRSRDGPETVMPMWGRALGGYGAWHPPRAPSMPTQAPDSSLQTRVPQAGPQAEQSSSLRRPGLAWASTCQPAAHQELEGTVPESSLPAPTGDGAQGQPTAWECARSQRRYSHCQKGRQPCIRWPRDRQTNLCVHTVGPGAPQPMGPSTFHQREKLDSEGHRTHTEHTAPEAESRAWAAGGRGGQGHGRHRASSWGMESSKVTVVTAVQP